MYRLRTLMPDGVYNRPAEYIGLHHQGGTAWTSLRQAIDFFKAEKYQDVAYNAMVTPQGVIWPGRDEAMISAAMKGLNERSISICLLGNLDIHEPTDAQLINAGLWLRDALKRHPGAKFIQHRDVWKITKNPLHATACPGRVAVKMRAARIIYLIACGFTLNQAKALAAAGR